MSMTGEYRRLNATSLEDLLGKVRHDPEAFSIYLYSELHRFNKRDPTLSIGKGWHGIHFILNGDPDEINSLAGSVVYGGQEVGADMSYGPVRYMTPSQVQNVSKALEAITEEEFKARFDPAAFRAADILWQLQSGTRSQTRTTPPSGGSSSPSPGCSRYLRCR